MPTNTACAPLVGVDFETLIAVGLAPFGQSGDKTGSIGRTPKSPIVADFDGKSAEDGLCSSTGIRVIGHSVDRGNLDKHCRTSTDRAHQ